MLGVFLLQYSPLINVCMFMHYECMKIMKFGNKYKKHLRGSTQATIQPLAIILTMALWVRSV